MMKIENSLAATDLNQFKQQPLELLLKQIYKYQKFRNDVILEKINKLNFKDSTVKSYINIAKAYLHHNSINPRVGGRFYEVIDDLKANCTAILTPSESDKGRILKPRVKTTPTSSPTPVEPQKQETTPRQYGVKIQNIIKLFPNKYACLAYIECYREFDDSKALSIVDVIIKYN